MFLGSRTNMAAEGMPVITEIINLSLSTSHIPEKLRDAILSPNIKNALMDSEILKDFRTVSNVAFISKLIEKVVANQMDVNKLYECIQSAYHKEHSTETAPLHVQNDILCAVDDGCAVVLVLLDLSAAFDTVHHAVLMSILSTRCGIKGKALAWFESYLLDRTQYIGIQGVQSSSQNLKYDVPLASVLGSKLVSIYALPLGDIIWKHKLEFELYADDDQLYLVFKPNPEDSELARERVETCISELREWMAMNFLMLNDDKTVCLVIGSCFKDPPHLSNLTIASMEITKSNSAGNLGVIFYQGMTMEEHISYAVKNIIFSYL